MECLPLKTFEELDSWSSGDLIDCRVSTVPLADRKGRPKGIPKTLVCHDMCGGYLTDRFVQGADDPLPFVFYHWQYIDLFIYFSHHFVTIPPVTWINAAHKHGVKCYGTFITEWDEGKVRCHKVIESEESFKKAADKLVEITKYFQFDGWLINIENVVDGDKVENLRKFVEYLTSQIHQAIPGSGVIWYDSVLNTGQLKWQDELNDKNCMFFDACDGIFLNYNWNDGKLQNSLELAKNKGRDMDVYVGIDVFGRGCLGGGGYNTVEALAAIRKFNMSAAIFAPGWVWETQGKENFIENENRFWRLLESYLPSTEIISLPLSTTFCQGFGKKYNLLGDVVHEGSWYNLSLQERQPTCTNAQFPVVPEDQPSIMPCTEDPFSGGACLELSGNFPRVDQPLLFRLFDTSITLPHEDVIVSYTCKMADNTNCDLFLKLEVKAEDGSNQVWILREKEISKPQPNMTVYTPTEMVKDLPNATVSTNNGWATWNYCINCTAEVDVHVKSISFGLESTNAKGRQSVKIGQLQMIPKKDLESLATRDYVEEVKIEELSEEGRCRITWQCPSEAAVSYYNVYSTANGSKTLLGRSKTNCFYTETRYKGSVSIQPVFYSTIPGKTTVVK